MVFLRILLWTVLACVVTTLVRVICRRPSLDRNRALDQKILPTITFHRDSVTIRNVRNFHYGETEEDYTPGYYDRTYDLTKINSLHFMVEPFSPFHGLAHTMLSFGFSDGKYVSISIEVRKRQGEKFVARLSAFNHYEIVSMIGDERDLIGLRANQRHDNVYLYPIKARKTKIKKLFVTLLRQAQKWSEIPEFYNLFYRTCTTELLRAESKIGSIPLHYSRKIFLPAYADELLYDSGLIDTQLSLKDARNYYQINDVAARYADSPKFSEKIRKPRK